MEKSENIMCSGKWSFCDNHMSMTRATAAAAAADDDDIGILQAVAYLGFGKGRGEGDERMFFNDSLGLSTQQGLTAEPLVQWGVRSRAPAPWTWSTRFLDVWLKQKICPLFWNLNKTTDVVLTRRHRAMSPEYATACGSWWCDKFNIRFRCLRLCTIYTSTCNVYVALLHQENYHSFDRKHAYYLTLKFYKVVKRRVWGEVGWSSMIAALQICCRLFPNRILLKISYKNLHVWWFVAWMEWGLGRLWCFYCFVSQKNTKNNALLRNFTCV